MNRTLDTSDRAVRHLLRHLGDVKALRTNPIVAHLFNPQRRSNPRDHRRVEGAIRAAIGQCIAEMAHEYGNTERTRRCQQIVMRCDLAGEEHKAVAADLGICRRQLYRYRQMAREYLAARLQTRFQAPPATVIDAFGMRMSHVQAKRNAGNAHGALAGVETILREERRPRERVAALTTLADLLLELHEHNRAEEALAEARSTLAASETTARSNAECEARINAAEARLLWEQGFEQRATAADRDAAGLIERISHDPDPAVRQFGVSMALRCSWRSLSSGNFDAARDEVNAAQKLMETAGDAPAALRVNMLIARASLNCITNAEYPGSMQTLFEALEMSERESLPEHMLNALIALSVAQQLQGDINSAYRTALEPSEFARELSTPATYMLYILRLAELEVGLGNTQLAVQRTTQARSEGPGVSFASMVSLCIEAEALLRQGDAELAAERAEQAEAIAAQRGNARMRGATLRILAEAMHALGLRDRAVEHIRSCVAILETSGHRLSLQRAYATSERITGQAVTAG